MATGIEVKGLGALGIVSISTYARELPLFLNTRGRRNVGPGVPVTYTAKQAVPTQRNAPFIPTCGNMLPCMTNSPINAVAGYGNSVGFGAFGGLSAIIGCGALDSVITALKAGLATADKAGIDPGNGSYEAATQFISDHTGLSTDVILVGSSCDAAVAQGQQILTSLNNGLSMVGQTPVPVPVTPPSTPSIFDSLGGGGGTSILDSIKWVAIAGAVIAGAVVLLPIVKEAVMVHKLKRGAH